MQARSAIMLVAWVILLQVEDSVHSGSELRFFELDLRRRALAQRFPAEQDSPQVCLALPCHGAIVCFLSIVS